LVTSHYGGRDLAAAILSALAEAGGDVDHLGPADLFPVDQLHAGGAAATHHVLERMGLAPGARLLDVGCGIGGTSRMAAMAGALVTGIDLTPEFTQTATALTDRVGLSDRATFVTTAGESAPFDDASFDAAVMVHVGMNIPRKTVVFSQVHRVLAPGAPFVMFEQMRTADGELPYPLPWAVDERSSFVETPDEYVAHLAAAGFTVDEVEDRTTSTLGPPPVGRLSPVAVFGPVFAERVGNNIAATRAGLLGAFLVVARA
jgi:cyclopropane fatty-acyl-phospholipid synthase-like methyltransferase